MEELLNPFMNGCEVLPGALWLSALPTYDDYEAMQKLGIDCLVSIVANKETVRVPGGIRHVWRPWVETSDVPAKDILEVVESFGAKTFVHCQGGITRSPAIVIARLIYRSWRPLTAYEHVDWKRRHAKPVRPGYAASETGPHIHLGKAWSENLARFADLLRAERRQD